MGLLSKEVSVKSNKRSYVCIQYQLTFSIPLLSKELTMIAGITNKDASILANKVEIVLTHSRHRHTNS